MLDNQQFHNNWPKIKSQILSHWKELSEHDVDSTHGNISSLGKLIEETYGAKEDFNSVYDRICESVINSSSSNSDSRTNSESNSHKGRTVESEMVDTSMDKDRDDMYLAGPYGVTRNAEINGVRNSSTRNSNNHNENRYDEIRADGYNNIDKSTEIKFSGDPGHLLEEEILEPDLKGLEANEALTNPLTEFQNHKTTIDKQAPDEFTPNQDPRPKEKDINLGRSNSSANTTSQSAHTSSGAASKDTKKL